MGRLRWVSPTVESVLGLPPQRLIGCDLVDLVHPDERDRFRERARDALAGGRSQGPVRARLPMRDGGWAWHHLGIQPLLDGDGYRVNLVTAVSDRAALEPRVDAGGDESLYHAVIEALAEGVVVHDADGTIRAHNPRASEILGLGTDELEGRTSYDERWHAIHPDGSPFPGDTHPAMETLRDGAPRRAILMGLQHLDGSGTTWLSINSEPVMLPGTPATQGVVASFQDVTEREHQLQRLRLWEAAFAATSEAILITDSAGVIVSANAAFTHLSGYGVDNVVHTPLERYLVPDEDRGELDTGFWSRVARMGNWQGEATGRAAAGAPYRSRLSITAITDAIGGVSNFLCIASDISEQKRREETERYYAEHDLLTGLANRRRLYERLDLILRQANRFCWHAAVLYIDLDGFKPINDRFGHNVGDSLLGSLAGRLTAAVRDSDTVARLGGDEFVIVLPRIDARGDAETVAQKLADQLARPFRIDEHTLHIGASIGVAVYPEAAEDAQALLDKADASMYRAKRCNTSTFAVAPAG